MFAGLRASFPVLTARRIGGLQTRQTIGVVEQGWWIGDQISSGLMGLAYPILASGHRDLNYTSVVFSLCVLDQRLDHCANILSFEDGTVSPVFSLVLSRPSKDDPTSGGLLALGGVPDTGIDESDFVTVPIKPIMSSTYAFYSIPIDGFALFPPGTAEIRGEVVAPVDQNSTVATKPLILTDPFRHSAMPISTTRLASASQSYQGQPEGDFSTLGTIHNGAQSKLAFISSQRNSVRSVTPAGKFRPWVLANNSVPQNVKPPRSQTYQQSINTHIRLPLIPPSLAHLPIVPPAHTYQRKTNPNYHSVRPTRHATLDTRPDHRRPHPRPTPSGFASDAFDRQTDFSDLATDMVIDSGTTLMYLPDAVADYAASLFDPPAVFSTASNLYVVSCNAQAPSIAIIISGQPFYIDERDLLNGANAVGRRGLCVLAVQKQGSGDAVLGDAFLKNVVAVFDVERNEMSFAPRAVY
jgi:hypothetical protein